MTRKEMPGFQWAGAPGVVGASIKFRDPYLFQDKRVPGTGRYEDYFILLTFRTIHNIPTVIPANKRMTKGTEYGYSTPGSSL